MRSIARRAATASPQEPKSPRTMAAAQAARVSYAGSVQVGAHAVDTELAPAGWPGVAPAPATVGTLGLHATWLLEAVKQATNQRCLRQGQALVVRAQPERAASLVGHAWNAKRASTLIPLQRLLASVASLAPSRGLKGKQIAPRAVLDRSPSPQAAPSAPAVRLASFGRVSPLVTAAPKDPMRHSQAPTSASLVQQMPLR